LLEKRPLKILQYQYPYLNPYTKQIKVYLTRLMLQKQENWQKKLWQIGSESPNFFTAKAFYHTVATSING